MQRATSRMNKPAPPSPPPTFDTFVPWAVDALDEQLPAPTAITDRLPPSAPARRVQERAPAPALPAISLGRIPLVAVGGAILLVVAVLGGLLLAGRGGPSKGLVSAVGGGTARAATGAAQAAGAVSAAAAGDLSQMSEADLLPTGVPLKRTDWVITKDYAAHGGNDPVSRQKWGAVDFALWHNQNAFGAEIIATHAGKIKLLQDDPTYGNLVYVMGPHYTTTYGHMERFNVTEGQIVRRGDVIGYMGSTGNSTGPHVDYQVWKDGQNQNPMGFCQCGTEGPGVPK